MIIIIRIHARLTKSLSTRRVTELAVLKAGAAWLALIKKPGSAFHLSKFA